MEEKENFKWIKIAEKIADKVLEYKDKDNELMRIINDAREEVGLQKENKEGNEVNNTEGFSAMNMIFTKNLSNEHQKEFLEMFEKKIDMEDIKTYDSQEGIPIQRYRLRLTNGSEKNLRNALWDLFEIALKYADDKSQNNRIVFISRFNKVYEERKKGDEKNNKIKDFKRLLSIALYISRPYTYVPLDQNTKEELKKLKIDFDNIENGEGYLELVDNVNNYIKNTKNLPYTNIPELSAYAYEISRNKETNYYAGGCRYNADEDINKGGKIFFEKGRNILVYGVPGSGKSYYIKEKLEEIPEEQKERVIFYPEYSYYDFVGQNVPGEDGKLVFAPGPFTKILEKALRKENKNKNYYLIIEEMNRGNAEAIFGDILQLLDRNKDGKSEYGITNDMVINYLKNKECEVEEKLYIPSNLTIYATINNADQNVFSLDTAFSRRWEYEIKTCDSAEDIGKEGSKKYFESELKGIDEVEGENKYTWNEIRKAINNEILNNKEEIYNAEDKRLGLYYVDEDCLKEGSKQSYSDEEKKEYRKKFANKIFRYLWLDVFKNNRSLIFNENFKSLEDVITKFENDGKIGDILKINLDNAEN